MAAFYFFGEKITNLTSKLRGTEETPYKIILSLCNLL